MKRKRYTTEFKSQIVLEALKEEKSMSQIVSEHGIDVNVYLALTKVPDFSDFTKRAFPINILDVKPI
ncbi:transposase [Oceanobacillus sojae]|uniref:transposase n=1 Tax=Oceanobacillus sojae TaxID=582851 RepID=UPI000A05407E